MVAGVVGLGTDLVATTTGRSLARQPFSAHHAAMAENPYAMPLQEFEARMRVPVSEQSASQPVPAGTTDLDWGDGHLPPGGGGADGGCD